MFSVSGTFSTISLVITVLCSFSVQEEFDNNDVGVGKAVDGDLSKVQLTPSKLDPDRISLVLDHSALQD